MMTSVQRAGRPISRISSSVIDTAWLIATFNTLSVEAVFVKRYRSSRRCPSISSSSFRMMREKIQTMAFRGASSLLSH